MDKKDFIKVGKVLKANRKTGELSVSVRQVLKQTSEKPSYIFIEIDGGLVPFLATVFEVHNQEMLRLSLEDFNKPDKAQLLVGMNVYLDKKQLSIQPNKDFLPEDLIGFEVIENNFGQLGTIEQVVESSMQIILQINFDGKEILIPLVDDFITSVNIHRKTIYFDLPDGLVELYL